MTMQNMINKCYVSPYDVFLSDLRQKVAESDSQKAERLKHAEIAKKRDRVILRSKN